MILPKVGLISPHADFSKVAGDLAKEIGVNLVVNEYDHTDMAGVLRKWENGVSVEAVVTGEKIAAQLQGKTFIPVVTVRESCFDVFTALNKAKSVGKKVILADCICFSSPDISGFNSALGMDVQYLWFRERKQLVETLAKIKDKVDAVVGTTLTAVDGAREVGLPAFLIQGDRDVIRDALERAIQISKIRRKSFRLCKSLQAVLDNVHDGIIGVDERGEVVIFNPGAVSITGLSVENAMGEPMNKLLEANPMCKELFGDGNAVEGEVLSREGLTLVVNRVSVALGNQTGLLLVFHATERIRKIDSKIKRDLNRQGLLAQYRFSDIVGRSAMIEETIREARKYTRSDAAVLITGESGTGKELFAQSVHNESARRNGPFMAINCAALPESLLESELFGYEEGAFTGARKGGKQGLFAMANSGTIFLDEIGDLSPSLQARLLRVLQQKEVMPVGGQRVIPVDVRVISATNRNLQEAVEQGEFRVDLYYRLNVLHLHIPSLRVRLEDLPLLFKHFYQRLKGNRNDEMPIPDRVQEELKTYLWPGNVRELEGFVERYVALGEEDNENFTTFRSLLKKLQKNIQGENQLNNQQMLMVKLGSMEDMERQIIEQATELVEGGKGELAKLLGLSRTTLWKKLKNIDKTG